jgi:site-specific DNA-methyltransferase (adenine-specific)
MGDSIKILNEFPEKSVDLVFADPPYNLSNNGYTVHAGKRVSVNKGDWDKSEGVEKDFEFHFNWINACKRVLKENGTIWISGTYHSIYACGFVLQKQNWRILNDISWFKPNASPNLGCRMFTASHETLLWASKNSKAKHTFNYEQMKYGNFKSDFIKNPGKQMRSVWSIGTPKNEEKKFGKHPTQKPLELMKRIVLASSNKEDIVLDPFAGSATTGVAAISLGRQFIGIDKEEKYLKEIAIKRILDIEKVVDISFENQL